MSIAVEDSTPYAATESLSQPQAEAACEPAPTKLADLLSLTKPGITKMCVLMTVGGFWLAWASLPHQLSHCAYLLMTHFGFVVLGATLVVGGSCAINMVLEREGDKLMKRTASRPLPSGRLQVWEATLFGATITLVGLALLALFANWLTAGLAAFAWIVYVAIYTPLKRVTPAFLIVGTIPGAIPPLLGWTAISNQVDLVGMSLFAILVAWQLPHFLALSIMCHSDYESAGIRTVPLVRGERSTRAQAFAYSLLLVVVSLSLVSLQVAGWIYAIGAIGVGGWMVWIAAKGLLYAPKRWAYQLFFASLVYLPVITVALLFDRVISKWL